MNGVHLRRINPSRNMRRFYRLYVESDLFGGFMLMKAWGRLGTRGRIVAERYDSEAIALVALQKQVARKRRRDYQPITSKGASSHFAAV
jgi:predicted DNA-binding WGR domain protein